MHSWRLLLIVAIGVSGARADSAFPSMPINLEIHFDSAFPEYQFFWIHEVASSGREVVAVVCDPEKPFWLQGLKSDCHGVLVAVPRGVDLGKVPLKRVLETALRDKIPKGILASDKIKAPSPAPRSDARGYYAECHIQVISPENGIVVKLDPPHDYGPGWNNFKSNVWNFVWTYCIAIPLLTVVGVIGLVWGIVYLLGHRKQTPPQVK